MKKIAMLVISLLILMAPHAGQAIEVKGVEFPQTVSIEGTSCSLMGVGIRKKLIINVYLGALYLEKPTKDPILVIASDQKKQIVMHFLYKEVGADQLVEAWNEGFEKNAPDKIGVLRQKINRFNSFFTVSMKKGERMVVTYQPGKGTEVVIKGRSAGVIEGKDFMEALFSIWFGPSPPSKGLREGMLGK
jgi:hypothetical protein